MRKTKEFAPAAPWTSFLRLGALAVAGLFLLYLIAVVLAEGKAGGSGSSSSSSSSSSTRKLKSSRKERAAAAAVAAAAAEAYSEYRGHSHGEEAQDTEFIIPTGAGGAGGAGTCDHPPSSALDKAFATERFTLEKIVQKPGADEWRLCYPGAAHVAGTPNPKCPTSSFFIVNQRDASSDGVVDWLQGCVHALAVAAGSSGS